MFLRIVLFMLASALCFAAQAGDLPSFGPLALEADTLAKNLSLRDPLPPAPAPSRQALLSAAGIMQDAGACDTSVQLLRRAMSLGEPQTAPLWEKLARAAACAENWDLASRAAYNARRGYSGDDPAILVPLTLLATALENRHDWRRNWTGHALMAYRTALAWADNLGLERESRLLRLRVAELQARADSENTLLIDEPSVSTDDEVSICLGFNDDMPDPRALNYGDYIRFKPAFEAAFTRGYRGICAQGAKPGTRYTVTVRKGLKGESKTLRENSELQVQVDDRPAQLLFSTSAYVLAQTQTPRVPLRSVNVKKLDLTLLRIHPGNLLDRFVRNHFRSELGEYQVEEIADDIGERLWTRQIEFDDPHNEPTPHAIELDPERLAEPGLYVLYAADAAAQYDWNRATATQWLVVTDIGLSSYRGRDGLTVVARSLSDAEPLNGLEVALYARNNQVLSTLRSDATGRVHFPAGLLRGSGGREALSLVARHPAHGFALLDIEGPAFDLSEQDTGGRAQPGPLDLYVYTDRGAYRPGETVHAAALLRDDKGGAAPASLPLSLVLENSDGDKVDEQVLQPVTAGAYAVDLHLPESARTGRWRLALRAEAEAEPIGETRFLVEALLPPRLEADLTAAAAALIAGEPANLELNARYLFGAPGADLAVIADLELEPDPQPYPAYREFHFGRQQDDGNRNRRPLEEQRTDEAGKSQLRLRIDPAELTPGLYQRARIRAEVLDVDGRAVAASALLPIRDRSLALGIRPTFDPEALAAHGEAGFDLLALNTDGEASADTAVDWKLLREERQYRWYQNTNGAWNYHTEVSEHPLAMGRVHTDAKGIHRLTIPVDSGDFRLDISAGRPIEGSSLRFAAGSAADSGATRPDSLRVQTDRARYLPGDQARIRIQTPFRGSGNLVVAGDRIHRVIPFRADGDSTEVSVDVGNDWGPGAYALVSLFRPGRDNPDGAKRSVGVTWLALDDRPHRLDLTLQAPAVASPRQPLRVVARMRGAVSGEPVFLTLAAVDEGVLQLTRFASPDPLAWFFGKRQLGVGLRDAYGSLIRTPEGSQRSGAGASGRRGMPEQNIAITALFSGPLLVGEDGSVDIDLDVPEFTGRLRLMAVAATRERSGAAQGEVRIAEPVTAQVSKPRFLALGDHSRVTLTLHNLSGPEGDYRIRTSGDTRLAADDEQVLTDFTNGQRRVVSIPVHARSLGLGELRLTLEGPQDYHARRAIPIGVRGARLPQTRRQFLRLAAGDAFRPPADLTADLDADSLQLTASVQSSLNLDLPGVLRQLDLYPYGCLEQTTSRALPLLYQPELAGRWGLAETHQWRPRLERAVASLMEKQREDGSFGLWSDHDQAEPWLSAYASEFLVRARLAGIRVPRFAYAPAIEWLRDKTAENPGDEPDQLATLAYAHYVLALAGSPQLEDARYLLDSAGDRLPTALARAQMGATFALLGDSRRARQGFELALRAERPKNLHHDYGSQLRDLAATASLLLEHGSDDLDPAGLLARLADLLPQRQWLSTQELAWLALTARGLNAGADMQLSLAGGEVETHSGPLTLSPPEVQDRPWVTNRGERSVWLTVSADGTPLGEARATSADMEVRRSLYRPDGSEVDGPLRQGEALIVLLEGRAVTGLEHRALVVDALPAGLEVDNPRLADTRGLDAFQWLPKLSETRHVEPLDDRFVAALDLGDEQREFRIAYLARAVTPGEYALPPVTVEDMYKPQYRGNSASGRLTIIP